MDEVTIEIKKLVNGGQGLGFCEGKPVFAWNALPGETATIKLTKEKKEYLEGIAIQINNTSPERIAPREDHFLSCSPWQIMTYAHENHWKKEIVKETFKKLGNIELNDFNIVSNEKVFGYRNKMEYGFHAENKRGPISFAFHKRGSNELYPIDCCLLAKENINIAALNILSQLNEENANMADLKSLILRENSKGRVTASIITTNKNFRFSKHVMDRNALTSFQIYYSNPKSPAHKPAKLLTTYGDDFIVEEIADKTFNCGPLGFFQVNVDIFEKTLSRINTLVDEGEEVVDFYSGVGSIGISLGDKVKNCVLVESDNEASKLARENIKINRLRNFTAQTGSAENLLSEISEGKTIIFDPPRAGLHPSVIRRLLEVLPGKVIYLSCDVATQARDIKLLSQKYDVKFCELYNFFPRTPHIESLVALEKQ